MSNGEMASERLKVRKLVRFTELKLVFAIYYWQSDLIYLHTTPLIYQINCTIYPRGI